MADTYRDLLTCASKSYKATTYFIGGGGLGLGFRGGGGGGGLLAAAAVEAVDEELAVAV